MGSQDSNRRSTALIARVKHEGKWKRLTPVYGGNGQVKPGYALLGGEAVKFDQISYEIRTFVNRKPKYISAGYKAIRAEAERKRVEINLAAKRTLEAEGVAVIEPEERRTLRRVLDQYYADAHDRQAFEAEVQARLVGEEFVKVCRKTHLDEVTRQDVLKFHAALRERGCGPRTLANKHARLKSILIFGGADVKQAMPPKPKFDKTVPTVYTSDEIARIMEAAKGEMRVAVRLLYMCGLREQELVYLEFRDLDLADRLLHVRSKPKYRFKVKDSEERQIPLPEDIAEELRAWRRTHPDREFVLATSTGKPNTKLLRALKTLAKRAGLNCGNCDACVERGECEHWTLHQFRRTYLTTLLRNGIDLRSVQAIAGHSDLASTMRYLRPTSGGDLHKRLEAVKW